MKIIYVHGRLQQGKALTIKDEWDAILRQSFADAELEWPDGVLTVAPFYGDELAKRTDQADHGDLFGLIRKGDTPEADVAKAEFYREFLGEIAEKEGIRAEDLVATEPVPKGWENWRLPNALLRRLNEIQRVADISIHQVTRDVYYYLQYNFIRSYIDGIVEAEIPRDESCVVVSHSLGTMVAYDIFAQRRGDVDNICSWITLGSPLGIKAVYSRLPTQTPRIAPLGIESWYNARDPLDVVALNPISAEAFPGAPLVENDSTFVNQTKNHHGIAGYLDKKEIARRIRAAATGMA